MWFNELESIFGPCWRNPSVQIQLVTLIDFPKEWLGHQGTVDAFEREQLVKKAEAFNIPVEKVIAKMGSRPFGEQTKQWREFVAKLEEDDELWFFRSPQEMFARKLGCQGYAIVRDNRVVETFVTLMS